MATETKARSLAQRMLDVMGEVGYVQKQGHTDSGPKFSYVRHDDVVAAIRPALVKHGIAFMSTVEPGSMRCEHIGETRSGTARYKTTLLLELTFVNADDPADAYRVTFPGEGIDTDDKGSGKALSYALKNGLLKTFMVESGDEADPEHTTAQGGNGSGDAAPAADAGECITRTQARDLADMLYAKGRDARGFVAWLAEKHRLGDGEHLTSIPAREYGALVSFISELPDPEPPAREAASPAPPEEQPPAAAEQPALPADVVAAQQRAAARPDGCTLDSRFMECAAVKRGEEPQCEGCEHMDPSWAPLDAVTRVDVPAEAPKPAKRGTVTDGMLRRLGELCQGLEDEGVGREEWRRMMQEKEHVASRTELTKAAATRMIDYLSRWLTDLRTGTIGPSEKVA